MGRCAGPRKPRGRRESAPRVQKKKKERRRENMAEQRRRVRRKGRRGRERSGVIGEEARPLAPSEEEGRRGRAMRSPGFAPCKFSCTRAVLPCMHAERAAPTLDRLEAFFRIVGLGGAVCSV